MNWFKAATSDPEIGELGSGNKRSLGLLITFSLLSAAALAVLALFVSYLFNLSGGQLDQSGQVSRDLLALHHKWSSRYTQQWQNYLEWLKVHGTSFEYSGFDGVASMIGQNLLNSNSAAISEDELSTLGRIFIGLHGAALRVVFLCVAGWRLCVAVCLVSFLMGLRYFRPYKGNDSLGQMGNGRVFYSGARAALDSVDRFGAPNALIRGLACPQLSSEPAAKDSELWGVLSEFEATNATNLALVRILVRYRDTASFIPVDAEARAQYESAENLGLLDHATQVLRVALQTRALLVADAEPDTSDVAQDSQECNTDSYSDNLRSYLGAVLMPQNKQALGDVSDDELATLVLALEAGKVMAHSYEGGRWVRRSNFQHLCARSILHSIIPFASDYDTSARSRIRRGLVYAARKSAFAPIRLPSDFNATEFALRQWCELLMASPDNLHDIAAEVELFGLIRELSLLWQAEFFNPTGSMADNFKRNGLAGRGDLLFLPVGLVAREWRNLVDDSVVVKLRGLLKRVSNAQKREISATIRGDDDAATETLLAFERIADPPSDQEIENLSILHGLKSDELRDWVVLRYALSSFGWLASRVGDYTVPDTHTMFAVFGSKAPLAGANDLRLLGLPGMMAFRGGKMREVWGANWQTRYKTFERVTIAETQNDYQKLLRGIEDVTTIKETVEGFE